MDESPVVEKSVPNETLDESFFKKYSSAIIIASLVLIVVIVYYCNTPEGFTPDSSSARISQNQVRSDTNVDREWNLKELERSVALLNQNSN